MADAGSALSGAAAGAAAGSVVPGWGTAIGAALGLVGSLLSSGGNNSQEIQQRLAENNQIETGNQNRYAQALIQEAMRRAGAGTSDSFGTTTAYDPITNQWTTSLGPEPTNVQHASNTANINRAADVSGATYGNDQAGLQEALARRNLSGAGNALASYRDMSPDALKGDMMDATLRGNNAVFQPLMAETLRQASRTGTAAGPMIGDLGRQSADLIAKQMAENAVASKTNAAQINATNRASLGDTFKTFNTGTQVQRNYPGLPSADPSGQITQALATRQANLASPASLGAYGAPGRAGAATSAAQLGIANPGGVNTTAGLVSNIGRQGGNLIDTLTNGSGVWGDIRSLFSNTGNNDIPQGTGAFGLPGLQTDAAGRILGGA